MTAILPYRFPEGLSEATITAYEAKLKEARALLTPVPIIKDTVTDPWEKMGPVRRNESDNLMPVLKEHKDLLVEPLSIELAGNYLEFYDNSDKLIALHQAEIADIQRNKTIKGALGWNMVLACEAEIKHRAGQGNDLAISGRNALNKISRSKTNKGARSKKKGSKKDVPV